MRKNIVGQRMKCSMRWSVAGGPAPPTVLPFRDYAHRGSRTNPRVYSGTRGSKSDELHLICDAVSGMTDGQLISLHDELSEVSHGDGS